MQSLVHLYNTALAELGGEQIPLNISPIESDTVGAICQNLFPHVLDTALESYEWGFAKKRAVLAALPGEEPASRSYHFRYALPSDCIRPVRIVAPTRGAAFSDTEDRSPAYVIEGQSLLCNIEQAELVYVSRVSEPKRWPAYFADVLKYAMAAVLASARNNDLQQKRDNEQKYEYALAKACAKDRAAQNPRKPVSAWQTARGNHTAARADFRGWW